MGRGQCKWALAARGILQAQWVLMFVAAAVAPLVVRAWLPRLALALVGGDRVAVAASVALQRSRLEARGRCLAARTGRGGLRHRRLDRIRHDRPGRKRVNAAIACWRRRAPSTRSRPQVRTLKFFNEIDEGLWFYLNGIDLAPVPGTHPRYNTAYDLAHSFLTERLPSETIAHLEAKRQARDKQALIDWLDHSEPSTSYLLIRGSLYDGFAGDLAGRAVPLFRETGHETQRAGPAPGIRPQPALNHGRRRSAVAAPTPPSGAHSLIDRLRPSTRFRRSISPPPGHIDRVDTSDRRSRMVQKSGVTPVVWAVSFCANSLFCPTATTGKFDRHKVLIQNMKRSSRGGRCDDDKSGLARQGHATARTREYLTGGIVRRKRPQGFWSREDQADAMMPWTTDTKTGSSETAGRNRYPRLLLAKESFLPC